MKNLITLIMIASIWSSNMTVASNQSIEAMTQKAHEAFKALLLQVDKNNDGKISKAEYLLTGADKKELEDNFNAWDLNGDGFITEEEYVKANINTEAEKNIEDKKY